MPKGMSTDGRYPDITFHKAPTGRQAHVLGTGLRVWQLVKAFRALGEDATATAEYFEIDPRLVEEALQYARQYPDEIEVSINRHETFHAEASTVSERENGARDSKPEDRG